jgi:hypothetical protein
VNDLAKKLAKARGTSVSGMFSRLIRAMGRGHSQRRDPIGPIIRRVTGIARALRGKTGGYCANQRCPVHRFRFPTK